MDRSNLPAGYTGAVDAFVEGELIGSYPTVALAEADPELPETERERAATVELHAS